MTDRESIVAMLRKQAKEAHELAAKPCDADGRLSLLSLAAAAETFADQIERGEDLKPAKPKATIADLLALHDLDLGALTHKVGLRYMGGDFQLATAQADMLCGGFKVSDDERYDLVEEAERDSEWPPLEACRQLAVLGAKVRAALSAPQITKPAPRILQSADEAPCGSLVMPDNLDQPITLRMPSGRGYHLGYVTSRGMEDRPGWKWHEHDLRGPVTILAEGLTEAECRHLSGLSAADAIAWCERREESRRG